MFFFILNISMFSFYNHHILTKCLKFSHHRFFLISHIDIFHNHLRLLHNQYSVVACCIFFFKEYILKLTVNINVEARRSDAHTY